MPVLRQLPRWAWFGTAVLAFIAGQVNAVGYLGFRHESISNMTGNTSLLGIALGQGNAGETVHWVLAIAAFVLVDLTFTVGMYFGVPLLVAGLAQPWSQLDIAGRTVTAGRTMLLAVLMASLRPRGGSYLVDGVDTEDVAGDDLRIMAYTAEPGSEDAERLELAIVLGTQALA